MMSGLTQHRIVRLGAVVALFAGTGLLALPATPPPTPGAGAPTPFRWDADELFGALEEQYRRMGGGAGSIDEARAWADALEQEAGPALELATAAVDPDGASLSALAVRQMEYAVLGAAHAELLPAAQDFVVRVRVAVTRAAARWPADRRTHEALYRLVFGGRMAIEEALVQAGPDALPEVVPIEVVPSSTPFLDVGGVRVHSGDVLLSRGGAPTSALIARGSDFANTFSHAALAHVDPETGVGTVVESLIETGSTLTTVEEYLASKKHKILVLRLRPDHPAIVADPMLPHRAATRMLEQLREAPVRYDFAMAWSDDEAMFCSEVIHHAYRAEGVDLWSVRSAMTTPGLVRWLSAMGVREFQTLVPSDLEYDPQLRAVAEWRDAEALMDYRLDNAITDALLEEADRGADLGYAWYALPAARLVKAGAPLRVMAGGAPMIPVGMSADAALRVRTLVSTVNPLVKSELVRREAEYLEQSGYRAPYWDLVELARESLAAVREELGPALR
jgi:hypothetical protein